MQPNIIERVWRQDKMVNVDVLNGFVFTGEAGAHKFVISGKNVNTPVDISGTVTANFKNANGVLVPLTGTIEDGKAVVVLSQECYAVEGPFSLKIFADTVCIYAAIANVINSSGEVIAYPTAAIPDVHELIVEAQEIVHRLDNGYNAFPTLTVGPADTLTVTDGADDIPLKTLSVAIEPKQDLHGYDHPWFGGSGKNVLPEYIQSGSRSGITWIVNPDKTVTINGTAESTITIDAPDGTWAWDGTTDCWLSGCPAGGNNATGYSLRVDAANTVSAFSLPDEGNGVRLRSQNSTSPITGMTLHYRIVIRSGCVCNNIIFKPQLEIGSASTPYEPYSNICPITGYDTVNVTRTGKNLFNPDVKWVNEILDDNGNPTSGASKHTDLMYGFKPNTQYTIQGAIVNGNVSFRLYFRKATGEWISRTSAIGVTPYSFTTPSNCETIQLQISQALNPTNIQIELSSAATPYEPYQGQAQSFSVKSISGTTVYGGTLTVNEDGSGELVVKKALVDLGTLAWAKTGDRFMAGNISPSPLSSSSWNAGESTTKCSSYTYGIISSGSGVDKAVGFFNGSLFARDTSYATAEEFRAGCIGCQLTYLLATPQTYPLTAQEITTLLGTNHIACDAGQASMTYRADTKLYIDRKLAELAASIVNS